MLPSVRREVRNMIEEDRAASGLLCQSPVNVIVIPLINKLKTVNHCSLPAGKTIQFPDRIFEKWLDQEKFLRLSRGNGKRVSNVMYTKFRPKERLVTFFFLSGGGGGPQAQGPPSQYATGGIKYIPSNVTVVRTCSTVRTSSSIMVRMMSTARIEPAKNAMFLVVGKENSKV